MPVEPPHPHEDAPTEVDPSGAAATRRGAPVGSSRHASRGSTDGAPPPTGRIGPYRIDGEIGRGAMGIVWKGWDERLERPVAIKAVAGGFVQQEESLERFVREAKLLARLNHPHLATVHDLPQEDGRPFIVMELLDGESLASRLSRGPLTARETLDVGVHVASALEAAHAHGIVHRDLKPANVQVLSGGDVKVLDFGVAWSSASEDDEIGLLGTPAYMSPEQTRCEPLDGRSDLFALGAMLVECLTGRRCFDGSTVTQCLSAVRTAAPPLDALPADATAGLRELLGSCLEKRVDDRCASAAVVRDALEAEARALDSGEDTVPGGVPEASAASSRPPSLPVELDEFVGREEELVELSRRFDEGRRLVTLLGPGGSGKTRLVIRHGWKVAAEFEGGVWFCDLSEARTVRDVVRAVAATLGVPLTEEDSARQVGSALAARGPCLLVLDNFEQVVADAAETLGRWVKSAPEATFVVTSRVVLGLPGEDVMSVEPLPVTREGVRLFELRARARRRDFALTDEVWADVEEIVRLVDGLPLAIELAAARIRVLSPAQLLERMSDRFRLLAGGAGPERQATLRNAIDWSWDLLATWERAALAQLSVFEGGFTLEGADAVLDLERWPEAPWSLDVVQVLVDKSLVRSWTVESVDERPRGEERRFGMFVSIHEYAAEMLRTPGAIANGESGPESEREARARHARFFARFGAEDAVDALDTHGGTVRRRELTRELDNVRAACRWAIERGDAPVATATLAATWAALLYMGSASIASEWAAEILELPSLHPRDRLRVLEVLGVATMRAGDPKSAHEHHLAALELARELGDRSAVANVQRHLGGLRQFHEGPKGSVGHFEAALAVHREKGERGREVLALGGLAGALFWSGRIDEAEAMYAEALRLSHEVGDTRSGALCLSGLGAVAAERGDMELAATHAEECVTINRRTGDRRGESLHLTQLGIYLAQLGRMPEARDRFELAVRIGREIGDRRMAGGGLANLASLEALEGHAAEARRHFEEALAIHREVGNRRLEGIALCDIGALLAEDAHAVEAIEHFEESARILRGIGDGVSLGRVLGQTCLSMLKLGEEERARSCLREAEEIAARQGSGEGSELGQLIASARQALRDLEQ